ncbi:MAG: HD domain-containing protein [Lachnospiraceae bacterium]|nr:HD domain-containing protein [Lachnospiraceae bacterium]
MFGSSLRTAEYLISIMEMRDPNLNGHSLHIEKLSMLIYDELPMRMKLTLKREDLAYAALFHDLGQVGVTGTIAKAGKLTNDERKAIRRHPEVSVEILQQIGGFNGILKGIRYHHERMDGKGYYEIGRENIPLISKILAVADAFSAVTVLKSYKPSRTYEDGISALRLGAGKQFDAEIVEIFSMIPRHKVNACAEEVRRQVAMLESIIH